MFHLAGMSALLDGELKPPPGEGTAAGEWGETPLQATLSRLAAMGSWLKVALEKEGGAGPFPWSDQKIPGAATAPPVAAATGAVVGDTPSKPTNGEGGGDADALLFQQQQDQMFQEALEKASVGQRFPRGRTRRT